MLINSDLERKAALFDHETHLIADGEEIGAFASPATDTGLRLPLE